MDAKRDAEKLMNAVVAFAKQMLTTYGEFQPYGGILMADGRFIDVGVQCGEEHPRGKDVLNSLREYLRQEATRAHVQATAMVLNVHLTKLRSDAIQVTLEHRNGYCAEVFYPYRIAGRGAVLYGRMFEQAGEREIFLLH